MPEAVVVDASAMVELASAPLVRHQLPSLLAGAWAREPLRLVDALYVELCNVLGVTLITTDGRLARASPEVELVS